MKNKIERAMVQWIKRHFDEYISRQTEKNLPIDSSDFLTANNELKGILNSEQFNRYTHQYHVPFVAISKINFSNKKALKRLLQLIRFLMDEKVPEASTRTLLLMLAAIALNGNKTAIQWDSGVFQNGLVNDSRLRRFASLIGVKTVTAGSVSTQTSLGKQLAKKIGIVTENSLHEFSLDTSNFWCKKLLEKIGIEN